MRKIPDTPFPLTAWLQALVQLVACLVLMIPLRWWPSAVAPLALDEGMGQWFWAAGVWLVFAVLLAEVIVRQSQNLAYPLSRGNGFALRMVTFLLVVPSLQLLFVTLETLLIWMEAVMHPATSARVVFGAEWMRCFQQDAGWAGIFAVAELCRQLGYRHAIQAWVDARNQRKRAKPVNDERDWEDA